MTLDDPAVVLMGQEPILDGERVLGDVTSANYGYTVRRIAYGYLPVASAAPGTKVEVLYFGRRYPATVAAEPLYDPRGERLQRVSAGRHHARSPGPGTAGPSPASLHRFEILTRTVPASRTRQQDPSDGRRSCAT